MRDPKHNAPARRLTMRGRILLAFGGMGLVTLLLGLQAVRSVDHAGGLMVRTFDNALMSVSYARSAAAAFAGMGSALARVRAAPDEDARGRRREDLDALREGFEADLHIARDRALSPRAIRAAGLAEEAAATWAATAAPLLAEDGQVEAGHAAALQALEAKSLEVSEALELLVEHVSGDAFLYRRAAEAEVAASLRLNAAGTALSLGVAAIIALVLARRILGPVGAASRAASAIAAGRLDTPIPQAGPDELGAMLGAMAVMRDAIRSKIETEETARRDAEGRFAAALGNMSQGLVMFGPTGQLMVVNERFAEMHRLPPGAAAPGMTHRALVEAMHLAGGAAPEEAARLAGDSDRVQVRRGGGWAHGTVDGRFFAVSRSPMPDGGWVETYDDVTERRRAEARIAHMTGHDALTGLSNRTRFGEDAGRAAAGGARVAIHCLNLDRFSEVNDAFGHAAGDGVLRGVAERLLSILREGETVARLNGDEFAVLQPGADLEAASELVDRLRGVLALPHAIGGEEVVVSACIGTALALPGGAQAEEILRDATLALGQAQADGRGGHRVYRAATDNAVRARRGLEADLRRALATESLEMHYQPVVDLASGGVSGFEALMRWSLPDRGPIPPGIFIPIAEEAGLIAELGAFALRRACAEAAGWPDGVRVAVNVSPAQFAGGSVEAVIEAALRESGLAPERLEIEVTESTLLVDGAATVRVLNALRARGVRVAMDDFGTGYSSLATLRSFPFDKIKIDQSFVRGPGADNPQANAIVRSVSSLARELGMRCTAEGVETAEQLARLRAAGATDVQGYLFGRPAAASSVPAVVARFGTILRPIVQDHPGRINNR